MSDFQVYLRAAYVLNRANAETRLFDSIIQPTRVDSVKYRLMVLPSSQALRKFTSRR